MWPAGQAGSEGQLTPQSGGERFSQGYASQWLKEADTLSVGEGALSVRQTRASMKRLGIKGVTDHPLAVYPPATECPGFRHTLAQISQPRGRQRAL